MPAGKRHAKNVRRPDSSNRFSHHTRDLVELGDLTVGRSVHRPGWSWSTHIRPTVGGDWCEVRHVGYVVSGRFGIRFRDGTTLELEPDDVFDLPPGHDSWVIGDEDCVLLEWTGMRRWRTAPGGGRHRALVTLMLTDVVGSTELATRLGDAAWDELLATHYENEQAQSSNASAAMRLQRPATGCLRHSADQPWRWSAPKRSPEARGLTGFTYERACMQARLSSSVTTSEALPCTKRHGSRNKRSRTKCWCLRPPRRSQRRRATSSKTVACITSRVSKATAAFSRWYQGLYEAEERGDGTSATAATPPSCSGLALDADGNERCPMRSKPWRKSSTRRPGPEGARSADLCLTSAHRTRAQNVGDERRQARHIGTYALVAVDAQIAGYAL